MKRDRASDGIRRLVGVTALGAVLCAPGGVRADEPHPTEAAATHGVEAAAGAPTEVSNTVAFRLAENPLAGVVRFPTVNNTLFNIGPNDQTANLLAFAPIVPIRFPHGYSILTRTIIPIVTSPDVAAGSGSTTGLGDIQFELLPHKLFRQPNGDFIDLALGPVVVFPTATDDLLGAGKWQLGPQVAVSVMTGAFVGALLARNLWSVGGEDDRPDQHRLFLETILFYNLPKLWHLVSEPQIVANWENSEGNRWTLPLGGGFGRVFLLPSSPNLALTARLQAFYNVIRPDNLARGEISPEWSIRVNIVFFQPNPLALEP